MRVDRNLSEPKMREAMSRLYTAMVLSEPNTEMIRNGTAGRGSVEADGNPIAVSCMIGLDRWLYALKMHAEPDLFEEAIARPIRMSAEFLRHMRTLRPRRSISITALVFEVSEPHYDPVTDRNIRTVSAISPDVENAVYVRMDDWDWSGVPGWYVFTGVQPILLVNRLRMTKGSTVTPAGPGAGRAGLGGLNFLNCPLSGAEAFRRSLAMENFCEVRSWQAGGKHMLGAPLVLHGRVSGISPHRISLAGCDRGGTFLSAYLSEGAAGMLPAGRTGEVYVRALAVAWYRGDADAGTAPDMEVYMIEETDRGGAVAGDAAGLARVEGPVGVEEMHDRYGCVPESDLLERRGDRVIFRRTGGMSGGLHREFAQRVDEIREARRAGHSIHCFPEDVFSDRITDDRITHELGYAKTRDDLLSIIEAEDRGCAAAEGPAGGGDGPTSRSVWVLKQLGLVEGTADAPAATPSGRRHGYRCAADVMVRRLDSLKAAVFVPDLDAPGIPPSFVPKYLKAGGYRASTVRGSKCGMVMSMEDAPEQDLGACAHRAGEWMDAILREFDAVAHPLTPAYLAEKLGAGRPGVPPAYVESILNAMADGGAVKRDGGSWRVPLEDRIMRVLGKSPGRALRKQQIMSGASIPGMDRDAADAALEKLRSSGAALEVLRDRWTGASGAADALAREVYEEAVSLYRKMPENRRRRMGSAAFLPYLERRLHDLGMRAGRQEAARRAVDMMVWDGA